jgi:hypothetical protein
VGQRTFETRSLYLIFAEKLFALPAANEMLPLSALFAGKYREVGMATRISCSPAGLGSEEALPKPRAFFITNQSGGSN